MLKAVSKDGTTTILALLSKERIIQLRLTEIFFCPSCKEKVIIRVGDKRIAHFAHQRKSQCVLSAGEGEYHEQGKLDLYHWLKNQGYYVELETYLPQIKQRPDLLLFHKNKKVAIEYQCATIPTKQFVSRTIGYKKLGITPIWILGGNRFKRDKQQQISITPTDQHFIHQLNSRLPISYLYYCSNTKEFAISYNGWLSGRRTVIGNLIIRPIRSLKFVDLFNISSNNDTEKVKLWLYEKKRFRFKNQIHPSKDEKQWRQWLYLHRSHPSTLPAMIYLPVLSQWKMTVPPWNWQSRLWFDLIIKKKRVTLSDCQYLCRNYISPDFYFPLVSPKHEPINEYLTLLTHLGYIKKVSKQTFELQKELISYKSLDQALEHDKLIMNHFTSIRKSSNT
ncbi:competence protein CoiA [Paraliobacillus salinarum]|uniref:competence protein CoiA n=1 Tax=Paraliobacillus salinarum TaxID=1158996 RepID=UPI0015F54E67|nr:competence protein CoiA family protein [Paraliobacillus salinarum]